MDYHEILSHFPNENLGKNEFGEDMLYLISEDGTYGVFGYDEDGTPLGIMHVFEDKTAGSGRILEFRLENEAVASVRFHYKDLEGDCWHYY